ncbi:hypothetical protein H6768_04965 [Candidatus Peribacteria bacterium]|nr:hypothetical protein [Candidatus Peribacteria bacterium]
MKISKILISLACALCALPSFGQDNGEKDKELFNFSATTVEASKTLETKLVTKVAEVKTDAKTETKTEDIVPSALVADAQTLIKDKLVQKYQVRLDEVIGRMTNRLNSVSPDEQRIALNDLRDRMSEKKVVVSEMKDLEPLKKDIITAILDHVIFRLE